MPPSQELRRRHACDLMQYVRLDGSTHPSTHARRRSATGSQGASQQPQAHCARRTDRRACQGHMRGKDSTHCPVSPTHSCALTSHPLSCRLRLEAGPWSMVATLLDILGHVSEHVSRSLVPRLWSTWEHMDIDMPCGNCSSGGSAESPYTSTSLGACVGAGRGAGLSPTGWELVCDVGSVPGYCR